MSLRVLFFAYYFPPSAGPGVRRSVRFVKELPGLGIDSNQAQRPHVAVVHMIGCTYPDIVRQRSQRIYRSCLVSGTRYKENDEQN